jgi:hypothetical protein
VTTQSFRTATMMQMLAVPKPFESFPINSDVDSGFSSLEIVLCCLAFLILLFASIFFINTWNIRKNYQMFQRHTQELQRIRGQ